MASTIQLQRITVLPNGAFQTGPPLVSTVRVEFSGQTNTVDADNPGIQYNAPFNLGINYDDIAPGPAKTALDAFLADFAGDDDMIATLFPVV